MRANTRQRDTYRWVCRCTWLQSGIEKRNAIRGIALDSSYDKESWNANEELSSAYIPDH